MTRQAPAEAWTDERLRAAFATVAEVAGDGSTCPSAEALWACAAGPQQGEDFEATILHLTECPACATAWRLARDLQRDAETVVLSGHARWFRRTWVQAAAVAATLALAVGLVAYTRLGGLSRGPAAEFRGREGDWIHCLVPADEALPRDRCRLAWTAGPAGTVYDVRVTTEDLTHVVRALGLEQPELVVPAEKLAHVPAGGNVVWQVRAHLPDGALADSPAFRTTVR